MFMERVRSTRFCCRKVGRGFVLDRGPDRERSCGGCHRRGMHWFDGLEGRKERGEDYELDEHSVLDDMTGIVNPSQLNL